MSELVLDRVLRMLIANNINDIRLTGGEPTMHPDFIPYLEKINNFGIKPRLITNGKKLIDAKHPLAILEKLSGCWISVYGVTQENHSKITGRRAKPLEKVFNFVRQYSLPSSWIGISAIITNETIEDVASFIEVAHNFGVRRLRFLFSEPSGRALRSGVVFHDYEKADSIKNTIKAYAEKKLFTSLAINNPFGFGAQPLSESCSSCLLHTRDLLSFSSDGRLYSCCFNLYDVDHYIGSVPEENEENLYLEMARQRSFFSQKCKGLAPNFWQGETFRPMCPISFIDFE